MRVAALTLAIERCEQRGCERGIELASVLVAVAFAGVLAFALALMLGCFGAALRAGVTIRKMLDHHCHSLLKSSEKYQDQESA